MNEIATLEFNVDFKPSEITIQNESQLNELVNKTVDYYSKLVFADENIPEAKQARADLNKVAKLLDDQRKAVKKEYSTPLKEFESKINVYASRIKGVSDSINESVSAHDENEKQKRLETLEKLIEEVAPNYKIEPTELQINQTWLNKGNFTTKGEVNKKTLEEITLQMKRIADEKQRLTNEKSMIGNYARAVGLEPESWIAQVENGLYATDLMKQIDATVIAKKEREEREENERQAKLEYEQAMKELREKQVNETTVIDDETGEILSYSAELERQEIEEYTTVELRLTGTHEQLSALNQFIVAESIRVEVI